MKTIRFVYFNFCVDGENTRKQKGKSSFCISGICLPRGAGTRADVISSAPLELISLPFLAARDFVADRIDFLDVILCGCREALIFTY
jgi:hypothetical protein